MARRRAKGLDCADRHSSWAEEASCGADDAEKMAFSRILAQATLSHSPLAWRLAEVELLLLAVTTERLSTHAPYHPE